MTDKGNKKAAAFCRPKPSLKGRAILSKEEAEELTVLFKTFASDTRLRLLHALVRGGELCVTELAGEIGMKPQAVSNQLQLLAGRSIVNSRRNGNQIYYRIIDPCVQDLLDRGLCLVEEAKNKRWQ